MCFFLVFSVIQDSQNPIEAAEKASLITAVVIHVRTSVSLSLSPLDFLFNFSFDFFHWLVILIVIVKGVQVKEMVKSEHVNRIGWLSPQLLEIK